MSIINGFYQSFALPFSLAFTPSSFLSECCSSIASWILNKIGFTTNSEEFSAPISQGREIEQISRSRFSSIALEICNLKNVIGMGLPKNYQGEERGILERNLHLIVDSDTYYPAKKNECFIDVLSKDSDENYLNYIKKLYNDNKHIEIFGDLFNAEFEQFRKGNSFTPEMKYAKLKKAISILYTYDRLAK